VGLPIGLLTPHSLSFLYKVFELFLKARQLPSSEPYYSSIVFLSTLFSFSFHIYENPYSFRPIRNLAERVVASPPVTAQTEPLIGFL
jgi:hypothetical protein